MGFARFAAAFLIANLSNPRYSRVMRKGSARFLLICAALLAAAPSLWPQQDGSGDIASNIGLRLEDLFLRFGAPGTVHAARGDEDWQDDVVFVYNEWDFYIYRDRVWQIGIKSGYGIKIGDAKAAALLVLADKARDNGDYLLYPITGGAWPLSLRVNFIANKVSGIFVYRTDF
jgi:hypothetical protein